MRPGHREETPEWFDGACHVVGGVDEERDSTLTLASSPSRD
jgi:hypothetical protein